MAKKQDRLPTNHDTVIDGFIEGVTLGPDISCALVAGTYLDELLREIIIEYARKVNGSNDEASNLVDGYRSICGTFDSKTRVAAAFGMIDKETATIIDKIRDIRNEYAHAGMQLSLPADKIDSLHPRAVANMHRLSPTMKGFGNFTDGWEGVNVLNPVRVKFIECVLHAGITLVHVLQRLKKANPTPQSSPVDQQK